MEEERIKQLKSETEGLYTNQPEYEKRAPTQSPNLSTEYNLKSGARTSQDIGLSSNENILKNFRDIITQNPGFRPDNNQNMLHTAPNEGDKLFKPNVTRTKPNDVNLDEESINFNQKWVQELIKSMNEVNARNAKLEIEKSLLIAQLQKDNEKESILEAIAKVSQGLAGFIESFTIFYQELIERKVFEDAMGTNTEEDVIQDILTNGETKLEKLRNLIDQLLFRAQQSPEDQEHYEAVIRDIHEKNFELQAILKEKTKDIQELVNYSESLRSRIHDLESEKSELMRSRGRSSEPIVFKGGADENDRMVQVFELLDGTLEVTLTQEEVKNLSVNQKFTELRNIIAQHEDLKQHYRSLQEENEYLEVTLESITNKLKAQQAEIDFLNRQIDNTRLEFSEFLKMDELQQFEKFKKENDALKASNESLARENAELRNMMQRLSADLSTLQGFSKIQREGTNNEVISEVKVLIENNRQISDKVVELTRSLEDKNAELKRLEREKKELSLNNQELTRKAENLQEFIEKMKSEADNRDKTINDLIQQVSTLIQTNESLKERLRVGKDPKAVTQMQGGDVRASLESNKEVIDRGQRLKRKIRGLADLLQLAYDEEDHEEVILKSIELELKSLQSNYEKLKKLTSRIVSDQGTDWLELNAKLAIHGIQIPKEQVASKMKSPESNRSAAIQTETPYTEKLNEKEELFDELSMLNNLKLESTLSDKLRLVEKLKEVFLKYFKRSNSSIVAGLEAVFEAIAELKGKLFTSERMLESATKHQGMEFGALNPEYSKNLVNFSKSKQQSRAGNLTPLSSHTNEAFEKDSEASKPGVGQSDTLYERIMAAIDDELGLLRNDKSNTMIKAASTLEKLKELIYNLRGGKATEKKNAEIAEEVKTPERSVEGFQVRKVAGAGAERYHEYDMNTNKQESQIKYDETSPQTRFHTEQSDPNTTPHPRKLSSHETYQVDGEVKYSSNKSLSLQKALQAHRAFLPDIHEEEASSIDIKANPPSRDQKYSSLQKSPTSDHETSTPIKNGRSSTSNQPENSLPEKPVITDENTLIDQRNLTTGETSLIGALRTTANLASLDGLRQSAAAETLSPSYSIDNLPASQLNSAKNAEKVYDKFFSAREKNVSNLRESQEAMRLKPEILKKNLPSSRMNREFMGRGLNTDLPEVLARKNTNDQALKEINKMKKKIRGNKIYISIGI